MIREQIKDLGTSLDFVVVATCHSEFVGKIFQGAGVKHVICIIQNQTVLDITAITFSRHFYSKVFQQRAKVCEAFKSA
jgi:hypothetical protein